MYWANPFAWVTRALVSERGRPNPGQDAAQRARLTQACRQQPPCCVPLLDAPTPVPTSLSPLMAAPQAINEFTASHWMVPDPNNPGALLGPEVLSFR